MRKMRIIMQWDYRELRRTTAFRLILYIAAAVTLAAAIGISIALSRQSWLGEAEARPLLDMFVGLVLYFLPMLVLLAFVWSFGNLPVIKEKVNGNIESLMATPVTPWDLWLGKSLSIFIPGYVVSLAAVVIVVVAMNLSAIVPATGEFVLPVATLVLGLVVNPAFFFGVLLFMILFGLANNPDVALGPSLIIGFGLMMGMPVGVGLGAFDLSSWSFALWYLLGTAVALGVVLFLSRMLTRQNIVLSSKGG